MLFKRVIVCLDVRDGRVVKGVSFEDLRDVGDPVELALRYEAEGADEIVFLDISASFEGRSTLLDVVSRTADNLFIPLTVGGGIGDVEDIARTLRAGADKVTVNTSAVERPDLLRDAAARFGSQCVVLSIDAKLERRRSELSMDPAAEHSVVGESYLERPWYRVFTHGGRTSTGHDAMVWAQEGARLGAGEILLTSIDQDGRRSGFDLELTARVAESVTVPVIASGGAGGAAHFRDAFVLAGADAALAAGIFHEGVTTVGAVKEALLREGIPVRPLPGPAQRLQEPPSPST
ncbi:MAG TPA: imidazole glycerol phosphate synthase subunit HisF [Longimicrobiales bacterium]|nr:imidazole glycerol phosphate synthase subunit HisF [Longimicrobiales bacterium]